MKASAFKHKHRHKYTNTQTHNKVDKDDKHRCIKYRAHGAEWLTWYSTSNSLIVERDSIFANYLRPF